MSGKSRDQDSRVRHAPVARCEDSPVSGNEKLLFDPVSGCGSVQGTVEELVSGGTDGESVWFGEPGMLLGIVQFRGRNSPSWEEL
ncbi:hypothetical protein Sjap_024423 [Stephania japonica]|uniref:Uncharacterized protein n=1 Tax=Stephania japonica TaxID=461633 RepID=A0AAP0HNY5_9MAGN